MSTVALAPLREAPSPARERETSLAVGRATYRPILTLDQGRVAGYEAVTLPDADPIPTALSNLQRPSAQRRDATARARATARLRGALAARPALCDGCFLAIEVDARTIVDLEARQILAALGELSGVVLVITGQTLHLSPDTLRRALHAIRARGARVALSATGVGAMDLRVLLDCEPDVITLDGHLVATTQDGAALALVELLAGVADKTGAALLATCVERADELDVLSHLGIRLAAGPVFGNPSADIRALATRALERLTPRPARPTDSMRSLLEIHAHARDICDAREMLASNPELEVVVLVDRSGHPRELVALSTGSGRRGSVTSVSLDTAVSDAARRAIARPTGERFHPLVCTDRAGRYVGVVRIERILERLAQLVG